MRVELLFPSKYLCAADFLEHGERALTIERVYQDDLRTADNETEKKALVQFKGAQKRLVLNKTNALAIAELFGPETNAWTGKRVTLYPARVSAFGKMVDAIRVRAAAPQGRPPSQPGPARTRHDEPPPDVPLPAFDSDSYPEAEAS